jgi:hypothetical protein
MTIVTDPTMRAACRRTRIASASIDAMIVLATALGGALLIPVDIGDSVAGVALAYYSITGALFGRSAGSQWLDAWRVARWRRSGRLGSPQSTHETRWSRLSSQWARFARPSDHSDRPQWHAVSNLVSPAANALPASPVLLEGFDAHTPDRDTAPGCIVAPPLKRERVVEQALLSLGGGVEGLGAESASAAS